MRRPIGGGPAVKVLEVPGNEWDAFRCRYNPKANSSCVLAVTEPNKLVFYSLDPLHGKGHRLGETAIVSPDDMRGWDLSPDGSRVAVVDRHKYGERIEVLTLADGTWHEISGQSAMQTPPAVGEEGTTFYQIAWAADGESFFVAAKIGDGSNLLHVTPEGKVQPLLVSGDYQNQFIFTPLPSPDGKFLAFVTKMWEGNVWMIDNF